MIDPSRLIPHPGSSNVPPARGSRGRGQDSPSLEQKKVPLCPRDEDLLQKCASLSVIFPAFNEEENIGTLLELARRVLPDLAETWEIIVVNDGSQDTTSA